MTFENDLEAKLWAQVYVVLIEKTPHYGAAKKADEAVLEFRGRLPEAEKSRGDQIATTVLEGIGVRPKP